MSAQAPAPFFLLFYNSEPRTSSGSAWPLWAPWAPRASSSEATHTCSPRPAAASPRAQ